MMKGIMFAITLFVVQCTPETSIPSDHWKKSQIRHYNHYAKVIDDVNYDIKVLNKNAVIIEASKKDFTQIFFLGGHKGEIEVRMSTASGLPMGITQESDLLLELGFQESLEGLQNELPEIAKMLKGYEKYSYSKNSQSSRRITIFAR